MVGTAPEPRLHCIMFVYENVMTILEYLSYKFIHRTPSEIREEASRNDSPVVKSAANLCRVISILYKRKPDD